MNNLLNIFIFVFKSVIYYTNSINIYENGYILFCPCMGRFGNQVEQYLGSLAFAKGLNRTLVLPAWVEYPVNTRQAIGVPFDKYFKVEAMLEYHQVITMEKFMKDIAPSVWPPEKRSAFCYSARKSQNNLGDGGCNAKDGNPFGPFWDKYNINFVESNFYGPLSFNSNLKENSELWNKKFPKKKYFVLAFTGAPGDFPALEENAGLQKYFIWSDYINNLADEFITNNIGNEPWLAIHLRIDSDWNNVCTGLSHYKNRHLFGSALCLGYHFEHGNKVTNEICLPSDDAILEQVKKEVKKLKAKALFIAADTHRITTKIKQIFGSKVKVLTYKQGYPQVDLAIMAKADMLIANCISTFSSIAIRERRLNNKPLTFWGIESLTIGDKTEL